MKGWERYGAALLASIVAALAGAPLFYCLAFASVAWLAALARSGTASPALVLAVALVGRALLAPSAYRTDDLHRYVWEGRVLAAGFSPYALAPDAPELAHLRDATWERINHRDHAAIYPPAALQFFRATSALGLREEGLRALFLALDAATVIVLLWWLRAERRPPGFALIYAWSPLAALAVSAGHLEPLALLPLACTGLAWARGRFALAGALLALAASAKLFPLLVLPWMLARRPRAVALGFAPVAALAVLSVAESGDPFGPLLHFGRAFAFNGSLFEWIESVAPGAARSVCGLLLAATCIAVARSSLGFAAACAAAFASLLLCAPTVHFWYLAWPLLPLAVVGPTRAAAPFLAWCASILALFPIYETAYWGGAFLERRSYAWIEYAIPALVLAWALFGRRARRKPLAARATPPAPCGSFAVVVPSRGEAQSLRELLPRWLASGARRVVVADTPTGDGTRELCALDPRIAYVEVARRGYGAAVLAGLEAAGPVDFLVVSDADHADGPSSVRALLAPLGDASIGLVCAARPEHARLSRVQRSGNALVCACIARVFGRRFHDLGPFRALRRTDWPAGSLVDARFGINVEMNVRALQRGIGVVELELPRAPRLHGEDRISRTWRGALGAGRGMLARLALCALDPPRASAVLLVKVPGALPVKTRLARELGEARALELHAEMLRETLGRARVLDARPTIAFSPRDADARAALPGLGACRFLPLEATEAAACLEEALERAFAGRPLVALGGDSPDLPVALLERALRAARRGDAALVPTPDGGFACLALPRPVRGLAHAFAFGAGDACSALRAFLDARGLRVRVLDAWPDVDTVEDLARWARRSGRDDGERASETRVASAARVLSGRESS